MAKKSKRRIALGHDDAPLSSNPFGGLSDLHGPASAETETASEAVESSNDTSEIRPYRIERTRKGGLPIFVEKRAKGKVVTVVRNVSGDCHALLSLLKSRCGAGGVARKDEVEIQGDQRMKVEKILGECS